MAFKLNNNKIKEVISELKKASKTHAGQAKKLESAMKKRMGEFKHSDAPDAKGKFKTLPPRKLAQFIKRTRKTLSRSIASLNQQIVFNRKKNPSYAAKMKTTQNIVRKLFGKNKA
jgi:hypothetical protein|tara:strand:+ start:312 stop:656 length:345 start_codon:yes stop_codon:yes gene_type:complete